MSESKMEKIRSKLKFAPEDYKIAFMKNSMANTSKKIKKMSRLALFLAMGIILNYVESLIPIPIPINGVKLGLANTLGLVILYYYF